MAMASNDKLRRARIGRPRAHWSNSPRCGLRASPSFSSPNFVTDTPSQSCRAIRADSIGAPRMPAEWGPARSGPPVLLVVGPLIRKPSHPLAPGAIAAGCQVGAHEGLDLVVVQPVHGTDLGKAHVVAERHLDDLTHRGWVERAGVWWDRVGHGGMEKVWRRGMEMAAWTVVGYWLPRRNPPRPRRVCPALWHARR